MSLETIVVDEEVTLRPYDARDAEAFFRLIDANRDHLARWVPAFGFVHTVDHERVALEGLEASQRKGDMLGGAIEYLGRLVGGASIRGLESEGLPATLGYWIVEDVQGKGIATRACRALLDRAFGEMALSRVEISVAAGNARSRAVAGRLGFTLEKVLRQSFLCGGRLHDLAMYSLLAAEWPSSTG